MKYGIQIFCRIRPTKKTTGHCEFGEGEDGLPTFNITVPRSEASGVVNNKRETFSFKFSHVFDQDSKQEDIFENVAKGVIDNCLQGYNGTIFAYGQTGSGKTFTITGGAEKYNDRGIIPRTISYLFQQYEKTAGVIHSTHISYLEIYNECGYDLLDPKHEGAKLEDLPRATLFEDGEGSIHLKNLSLHPVTSEEEALNWLFMGDTNRMIAETPMNMASTRSHCIFTIHLSSREPGSDVIRKAKLHLVDLAGSERIGKTGVGGTLLTEAKYINLSLHYLEQVIVALSERSRTHIPYRNSMLTSVLRDSLGGNCMTTMIATCSIEKRNIEETISTCRFSQRVALIKNEAIQNEELDPKQMVERLKQQIQQLKEELTLATGEQHTDELTQEEKDRCHELVQLYLKDKNPEVQLLVGGDMRKIQLCFQLLKTEVLRNYTTANTEPKCSETKGDNSSVDVANDEGCVTKDVEVVATDKELQRLRELLKQRDDEINVLLKMLKQEKRRAAEGEAALKEAGLPPLRPISPILGRTSPPAQSLFPSLNSQEQSNSCAAMKTSPRQRDIVSMDTGISMDSNHHSKSTLSPEGRDASAVRQEAFDLFMRDYADTTAVETHKKALKSKYAEAKALGEEVNSLRTAINQSKTQIEQLRVSRGVHGLTSSTTGLELSEDLSTEENLKQKIEEQKASFKAKYILLKSLKTEIEHTQHLLEVAKLTLQKDFEAWWIKHSAGRSSLTSRHPTTSLPPSRPASSHRTKLKQAGMIAAQFSHHPTTQSSSTPDNGLGTSVQSLSSSPGLGTGTLYSSRKTEINTDAGGGLSSFRSSVSASSATLPSLSNRSVPLTGDSKADADILAFYKARQKLIQKSSRLPSPRH